MTYSLYVHRSLTTATAAQPFGAEDLSQGLFNGPPMWVYLCLWLLGKKPTLLIWQHGCCALLAFAVISVGPTITNAMPPEEQIFSQATNKQMILLIGDSQMRRTFEALVVKLLKRRDNSTDLKSHEVTETNTWSPRMCVTSTRDENLCRSRGVCFLQRYQYVQISSRVYLGYIALARPFCHGYTKHFQLASSIARVVSVVTNPNIWVCVHGKRYGYWRANGLVQRVLSQEKTTALFLSDVSQLRSAYDRYFPEARKLYLDLTSVYEFYHAHISSNRNHQGKKTTQDLNCMRANAATVRAHSRLWQWNFTYPKHVARYLSTACFFPDGHLTDHGIHLLLLNNKLLKHAIDLYVY